MEQVGAYKVQFSIARGRFGDVRCARKGSDSSAEEVYALKIYSKAKLKKISLCEYDLCGILARYSGQQRFEKECLILQSLSHPNVVRFYEAFQDDEEGLVVLVTKYVPLGPLMHFEAGTQQYVYNATLVERYKGVFEVEDVLHHFRDIAQAVAYLHSHNVCHRDIKPANILVSSTLTLVLCDFGAAEQFNTTSVQSHSINPNETSFSNTPSSYRLLQQQCNPGGLVSNTTGSPADWAPEAIFPERFHNDCGLDLSFDVANLQLNDVSIDENDGEGGRTKKIARFSAYGLDMWTLGVLLFEMFYLKHPFYLADLSEIELYDRIANYDPLQLGSALSSTTMFSIEQSAEKTNCCDTQTCSNSSAFTKSAHNHSPGPTKHAPSDPVRICAPTDEAQAILGGLLQKEPSMRWSIDTLSALQVFM